MLSPPPVCSLFYPPSHVTVSTYDDDVAMRIERQRLTLNNHRRRVQQSSTFQSAHMNPAELDDLCTQLTSKAKCNGKGAVIDEKEVNRILGPKPSGAAEGKGMFGNFVTGLEP